MSDATLNGYRLIAFDVDGTLVQNHAGKVVWELLNHHLCGDDSINIERFAAFRRKEISYEQWVELDVSDWIAAKATKPQIATIIREHLSLTDGAAKTLARLQACGYQLAVISGTLDITIELLLPEHPFDFVHTNKLHFSADGVLTGWQATPYDMAGKADALRSICESVGATLDQTVYVGDNINDLDVMAIAGLAIAFDPKKASVAEAADYVVNDNLEPVANILGCG
jgi:phosphoserine phosphatase